MKSWSRRKKKVETDDDVIDFGLLQGEGCRISFNMDKMRNDLNFIKDEMKEWVNEEENGDEEEESIIEFDDDIIDFGFVKGEQCGKVQFSTEKLQNDIKFVMGDALMELYGPLRDDVCGMVANIGFPKKNISRPQRTRTRISRGG